MAEFENPFLIKSQNPFGRIDQVIAVMSGKGGVGKSSVTALLASALKERGFQVGILDADITGPSIPKLFGVAGRLQTYDGHIIPAESGHGVKMVSSNLLLENEEDPVIWLGPLVGGMIKQFFEEVDWGDLDFLLVDLPPGTGDVPLSVMQTLPVTGLVMVSSPQKLVAMIVKKAIHMAERMQIPVVGLIENYSYFQCPDCRKRVEIFGASRAQSIAAEVRIPLLGRLPIRPELAEKGDAGQIEAVHRDEPEFFKEVTDNFLVHSNCKTNCQL